MATTDLDPQRYWEQRLAEQYTLGSVGWSGLGESFNRWMYAVRRQVFERCAAATLDHPSSLRVLDVGSGTGFYIREWQRLGVREISGSDFTSTAVEHLHARFPGVAIHHLDIGGDGAQLPAEVYDVISIMDVLYHITDDERYARALGNLARLLQPNGALILTENLVQRAQVDRHQVSRPRAVITDMLAEVGFEPVLVKPMFFLMNAPVDSDSRLLRWWWRRLVVAVGHGDAAGWLLGALTYPVELALLRWCRRGPSSKIIVCRLRRERMGHGPPLPT